MWYYGKTMTNKLFIPLLLGTNRKENKSEHAARWLLGRVEKRSDIETVFLKAQDFKIPHDNCGEDIKDQFPGYRDAIIRADGLIIVAPEYNHGYPGILKSILDLLLKEYHHKAVGIVGTGGTLGGGRMVENLLPVLRELGLIPIFKTMYFMRVGMLFDETGNVADKEYEGRADEFLDELVWMAETLKWGRENIPTTFRQ